ncbi:MAG: hypothetical protein RLZ10_1220 [Bacteroidota bacterium]
MNSFINILTFILTIPLLALTIFTGFDIPIDSFGITGSELRYRNEVFIALGALLFFVQLRRTTRRWLALAMVNKIDRFKWNELVSSSRKSRVITYNLLEALVMSSLAIGLYVINSETIIPAAVFAIFSLDSIVFILLGKNKFRVGLSSKAIFVADREIILIYFTGLRKVTIHQQTIFFDYINNLQLTFPLNCIREENRPSFFEALDQNIDKDRVFMDNIQKKL